MKRTAKLVHSWLICPRFRVSRGLLSSICQSVSPTNTTTAHFLLLSLFNLLPHLHTPTHPHYLAATLPLTAIPTIEIPSGLPRSPLIAISLAAETFYCIIQVFRLPSTLATNQEGIKASHPTSIRRTALQRSRRARRKESTSTENKSHLHLVTSRAKVPILVLIITKSLPFLHCPDLK